MTLLLLLFEIDLFEERCSSILEDSKTHKTRVVNVSVNGPIKGSDADGAIRFLHLNRYINSPRELCGAHLPPRTSSPPVWKCDYAQITASHRMSSGPKLEGHIFR